MDGVYMFELTNDELYCVGEAIQDRLNLLRELPEIEWRDMRITALESFADKIVNVMTQVRTEQQGRMN